MNKENIQTEIKNTYSKFCANVFLAKCGVKYDKGDTIQLTTKYGKEIDCVVHNLIYEKEGFYFYSITRSDGFDSRARAENKINKLTTASTNAKQKSNEYYEKSNEGKDFLSLAEPIKIGHHSEKRHRALIERNGNRMRKSIEFDKKAEEYESRVSYWEDQKNVINLSMPESIEYYEYKLNKAIGRHEGLKNGTIAKQHSYSMTYAKKDVNEAKKNYELAKRLRS